MSMWKKAMDYLGLGPDDAYDDYEEYDEPEPTRGPRRPPPDQRPRQQDDAEVRGPGSSPRPGPTDSVAIKPVPKTSDDSSVRIRRPRPSTEPTMVHAKSFNSAKEVGDRFRQGQAVIMNVEAADSETTRRLIDFASGLCYGLSGSMEKVSTGVFLLKPPKHANGHDESDHGS